MRYYLLLAAALAALPAACGSGVNPSQSLAERNASAHSRPPLLDTCEIARHPQRFDGQRVRLRAIVLTDIEMTDLTLPQCMWRRWDGKIAIDQRREWDFSGIDAAIIGASQRSTATRWYAAEGEFEGILRARPLVPPRNAVEPMPAFLAVIEVEKVDHVRVVEIPHSEPRSDSDNRHSIEPESNTN